MTKVNPQRIQGPWFEGFVLDVHTLGSQPIGTGPSGRTLFDTKHSDIGLLLNKLKYQADASVIPAVVEAAAQFWEAARPGIDLIVPVPASTARVVQPVQQLAAGLGAAMNIAVADCIKTTRQPAKLKDVSDPEKRKESVSGLYAVDPAVTRGKRVLLVDDLYRSGTTMRAVTEVLVGSGQAASVRAFADHADSEYQMNTVFIGGSRHISRLPEEAKERLKNIVSGKHRIIIGDAKGADAAVQKHLSSISYSSVVVYCSGEKCRNNIGRWKTKNVLVPKNETGFQFYALKDREMAREADFGFMIWDGESPGTLLNVLRLLLCDKKAVLLDTASKETKTFKSLQDWQKFISQADPILVDSLRSRTTSDEWPERELSLQASFLTDRENDSPKSEVTQQTIDAINKALENGDSASAIEALGETAKQRGMTELAKACGLARESLYRSLSGEGNPEFATILKVLHATGLKLAVEKG